MIAYLVRRLFIAVVVILGIMLVTFLLLHNAEGNPAKDVLGTKATPQAIAAFSKAHGFDLPAWRQFVDYVNQNVHGNFGYSFKLNQSVVSLFKENAGRSALLSGASLLLSILLAIPLGIYAGLKRNSLYDYTSTTLSFVFYSVPLFLVSLAAIDVFALKLNWLPFEASQSDSVIGVIKQANTMILPTACLVAVSLAAYSRYMRSSALDNLAQDYVKVARAKGLSERAVLLRHLLRNCCLPMITLIGLSIPDLLAGNLIVEQVFNYPGLGLLFYNSLGTADYPILTAYTLVGGVLVVLGNLVADVSLTIADPRVRLV